MRLVRVRLKPTWDESHTDVVITMSLPRQLAAWEVMDLCETLRARSTNTVRVVLPAVAPSDWLDGWCEVLGDAVVGRVEVQFVIPRAPRMRNRTGAPNNTQLEVDFARGRSERKRR